MLFTQVSLECYLILRLLIVSMAGIQPKDILLGILDDSAFARFEKDERECPLPRKELFGRTVYFSRPMPLTKGALKLCDLSEAHFGNAHNHDLVMPDAYRAPEVMLGMPWSYPIDLWGFAMTVRILNLAGAIYVPVAGSEKAVGPFRAEATLQTTRRERTVFGATSHHADDF